MNKSIGEILYGHNIRALLSELNAPTKYPDKFISKKEQQTKCQ